MWYVVELNGVSPNNQLYVKQMYALNRFKKAEIQVHKLAGGDVATWKQSEICGSSIWDVRSLDIHHEGMVQSVITKVTLIVTDRMITRPPDMIVVLFYESL